MNLPDIDIDTKNRNDVLIHFEGLYTEASMMQDGRYKKHPSGVYFQNVPVEPISGLCAFPSGETSGDIADRFGLVKLDILNNSAYTHINGYKDMTDLLEQPIDWSLLKDKEFVSKLAHIGNYFRVIEAYEPASIADLACILAIIRPGKKALLGESWEVIREKVWLKDEREGYAFKKSHAYGFALMITVQMKSLTR